MLSVGLLKDEVQGYFIECLLYNLPNGGFGTTSYETRLWIC